MFARDDGVLRFWDELRNIFKFQVSKLQLTFSIKI